MRTRRRLFTTNANLAASGNEASPFISVADTERLFIVRGANPGAGTLVVEIDWSNDGENVEAVQVVTADENEATELNAASVYARFRVRNSDGVNAFTGNPRTSVYAS